MKREFLTDLGLDDEKVNAIMAEHGKTVNSLKEKADNADGLQGQIDDLKKQVKDRDKQLSDLSKQAEGNEELQRKIDELTTQNENTQKEWESKLAQQRKDAKLELSLKDAKVRNPKAARALLNEEAISLDGDNLIGLEEQLKNLKESDGYLFEDDQPGIRGRQPNPNPTPPTPSDAMKKQYDEAIANGNTAQAISIKNQMFNQQKQE